MTTSRKKSERRRTLIIAGSVLTLPFLVLAVSVGPFVQVRVSQGPLYDEPAVRLLMVDAPLDDIVQAIEASGKDVDDITGHWGAGSNRKRILRLAVTLGRLDVAEWLLDHGADPRVDTGILRSVQLQGDAAMMALLLDRGPARSKSELSTLLASAVRLGDLRMIRVLIEHGADPDAPTTRGDLTPRAQAHRLGNPEVIDAINRERSTHANGRDRSKESTGTVSVSDDTTR